MIIKERERNKIKFIYFYHKYEKRQEEGKKITKLALRLK